MKTYVLPLALMVSKLTCLDFVTLSFSCTFKCHVAVCGVYTRYATQGVNLDQQTNQMQIKAAQTAVHRSVPTDSICIHIGSLHWPCTELRLVVENPGLIVFQLIVQQLSFLYCWLIMLGGQLELAVYQTLHKI